jgi:hypothetical protein
MRRAEARWERIGDNMPREIGDIGFPVVVHPREPDTAWTFPMDGTEVWPRVSPDGKPAVYVTRDGGKTFTRLDRGLPRSQAWFTVLRQAMSADTRDPVGVYFGTTAGEVSASDDEGESWTCIARHLPTSMRWKPRAEPMRVLIATPLRSYTGNQSPVEAEGATLADLLADLDRRYPGIRFA